MFGILSTIVVIVPLAWSCLALVTGHYLIPLPFIHPWLWWITVQAGPALLLGVSIFAYTRAHRWRRMRDMRITMQGDASAAMIRGHAPQSVQAGPSALERWCLRLVFLSLASMPYWLGLAGPEWWVGAGVLLIWITRTALR